MQADNNLRPYAFWDLAEMESAFHGKRANGSTLKLDVLVHLDTDQDRKLRRYHIYQSKNMPHSDVEYYKAWSDKNISSPIVQELDEEIETLKPQSEVFKEFLQWGMPIIHQSTTWLLSGDMVKVGQIHLLCSLAALPLMKVINKN